MQSNNPKAPSYLDVTQYLLTGPPLLHVTPIMTPQPPPLPQQLTPLSRPLFIQIQRQKPSPYLKELLSNAQIQFLDFTLEGPSKEDYMYDGEDDEHDQSQSEMSVISQEEQESHSEVVQQQKQEKQDVQIQNFQYDPQEYVPNMHLLELQGKTLTIQHFETSLVNLKHNSFQQKKDFLQLYMTDLDMIVHPEADQDLMTTLARRNLTVFFGNLNRLERKAKVALYLRKKKRRIFRKKISYACRKHVADNRVRIKGKFATKQQWAQSMRQQ